MGVWVTGCALHRSAPRMVTLPQDFPGDKAKDPTPTFLYLFCIYCIYRVQPSALKLGCCDVAFAAEQC